MISIQQTCEIPGFDWAMGELCEIGLFMVLPHGGGAPVLEAHCMQTERMGTSAASGGSICFILSRHFSVLHVSFVMYQDVLFISSIYDSAFLSVYPSPNQSFTSRIVKISFPVVYSHRYCASGYLIMEQA